MANQSDKPGQIAFGRWCFTTDTGDLSDGESTTRLEPQVAKLLEYFLTHQNVVISRDELIESVWEKRIVSDDAINRCVSILRQTLSPDSKQTYIETVIRKGYLAHFPAPALKHPGDLLPVRHRSYFLLAILAVLAVILVDNIIINQERLSWEDREQAMSGPPLVAVLPFTSANQDSDSEFFAHGIHNDLLTQLAKLQSMRVISATSVMEYRGIAKNVREIGEELGADVILEGSVQIAANQMRINAQLIDTSTDEHLWAETYDRTLSPVDIFDVQSEIARSIATKLHATLTVNDNKQLSLIPTKNMAAYRAFHRAMQIWETRDGTDDTKYIQALEQTVELDPAFTRAWAELVSVLSFQNFSGNKPEFTLRAEQALQHLQQVAPGSTDHLIGQAVYVYYTLKDYNQAHDIISQALSMNPSDVRVIELKSWIERRQGDFNAFVESRKESRRLDPRNLKWTNLLINALLLTHRYDEALTAVENSTTESFTIAYARSLLMFREQRDFNHFQQSVQKLCHLYEQPNCGWEVHIANRDYLAALDSFEQQEGESDSIVIEAAELNRIFTYWLMQDETSLSQGLTTWNAQLENGRNDSGEFPDSRSYIGAATLSGIQGNATEAVRLIDKWYRYRPVDWANHSLWSHNACRILGMAAATDAAVQCIKQGLKQATLIMAFWEPYLPFYDPIRDQPEFLEMLTEIDRRRP
jgi:TolB-like protein/tetratricopeptide (TPR) repeat protein